MLTSLAAPASGSMLVRPILADCPHSGAWMSLLIAATLVAAAQ